MPHDATASPAFADIKSKRRKYNSSDAQRENMAMVLYRAHDMRLVPWTMPDVGPDDLLIAVQKVGICGSDVHYFHEGRIGDFVVNEPMVIGHESSGIVIKAGSAVSDIFKEGDRIAMEPGVPCEACAQCQTMKYNLCPVLTGAVAPCKKSRQGFFATPPVHGSMAKFVSHPAKWCFKLPDNVSLEEGAMVEPLSVGLYAAEQRAKVKKGNTVVVFGAGPIGTIVALVTQALEAGRIILIDINMERLDFVQKKCIPGLLTLNSTGLSPEDVSEHIKELNDKRPVDSCIDCTGAESCLQAAILCTKAGGAVSIVGMGKPGIAVPILNAVVREVDLKGVFRYRHTYKKCIQLLSDKKIDVSPLITHRFDFTEQAILDAFEHCRTGKDGAIKCMIHVN